VAVAKALNFYTWVFHSVHSAQWTSASRFKAAGISPLLSWVSLEYIASWWITLRSGLFDFWTLDFGLWSFDYQNRHPPI
jgi:hypothetical protein